jgi:hypothetical protein
MRMPVKITALILLLAACRGERVAREEATPPQETAPPAASAQTAAPQQRATVVRRADGSELVTFAEAEDVVDISFLEGGTKRALRGEERDSGKRKYQLDGGAVLFEIKPDKDSDGFKLRAPDGSLRWKVKITPEKIKISNNEQNANAFELKLREGDRVKVVAPGEKEVGNVRFDRAASKTEIENADRKTAFTVDSANPSGAYGVLLLDSIPEMERYILAAEILSRGR